jgi:hypothetical protein
MKTYEWELKNGISRTKEFEKKGLAQFAVNIGLKCGHACTYCSTGAMLRVHPAFKQIGLSESNNGKWPERSRSLHGLMTLVQTTMFLRLDETG